MGEKILALAEKLYCTEMVDTPDEAIRLAEKFYACSVAQKHLNEIKKSVDSREEGYKIPL